MWDEQNILGIVGERKKEILTDREEAKSKWERQRHSERKRGKNKSQKKKKKILKKRKRENNKKKKKKKFQKWEIRTKKRKKWLKGKKMANEGTEKDTKARWKKSGSSSAVWHYTIIVEIIFDIGHKVRVQFGIIQSL